MKQCTNIEICLAEYPENASFFAFVCPIIFDVLEFCGISAVRGLKSVQFACTHRFISAVFALWYEDYSSRIGNPYQLAIHAVTLTGNCT